MKGNSKQKKTIIKEILNKSLVYNTKISQSNSTQFELNTINNSFLMHLQ